MAQQTWYVDVNAAPNGDGSAGQPFARIQVAIAQPSTSDGDTLLVLPGVYLENVDYLGKQIMLRSTGGAAATTIRASGGPVVRVAMGEAQGTVLEGFTVTGGTGEPGASGTRGGGVFCTGASLSIIDCIVRENTAGLGGGVYLLDSSTTILGSRVELNSSFVDGCGLWSQAGSLNVRDTVFVDNSVLGTHDGGGAFVATDGVTFRDCQFLSNHLGNILSPIGNQGGGVYSVGLNGQFIRCEFIGNSAEGGLGGGFFGSGELLGCTFVGNRAWTGGGVYEEGSLLGTDCLLENNTAITDSPAGLGGGAYGGTYSGCTFSDNLAWTEGGGASFATLIDCLVESNVSHGLLGFGGGGAGLADCTATGCIVRGNTFMQFGPFSIVKGGGGAWASTLNNCEVLDNTATSSGGNGLASGGGALDCQLTDCLIQGNACSAETDGGGLGGGLYGGFARGCRILDNSAQMSSTLNNAKGGGAAEATLEDCVVSGNTADYGGGVWGCVVTHSTLSGNVALVSGGAVSGAPAVQATPPSIFANSILWGNQPDEVALDGGLIRVNYSDVSGGQTGTGNIALDPLFWSAVTGDFQLAPRSPCIDAGDPQSQADPDGSRADMGALPFDPLHEPAPGVYCEAKQNSLGCLPQIGWSGSPTVGGADDFFVSATELVNQKPFIGIWSRSSAATPFLGGTLCLGTPLVRTPMQNSGGTGAGGPATCSGTASFHFSQAYAAAHTVTAGTAVFFQFWYRDSAHSDGFGIGLSNALAFVTLP